MISFVIIESIDYCAWSTKHPEDREGQPEPPHALPVTPFQLPLIHISDNLTLLSLAAISQAQGHGLRPQNGVLGNYDSSQSELAENPTFRAVRQGIAFS